MSNLTLDKTESLWPIECEIEAKEISMGKWTTIQQQLIGFNLSPSQQSEQLASLELHKDERTEYRFNLSSQQPKLFVVLDAFDGEENAKIVMITASQSVASRFMDGDYLVLSDDMPLVVQAWMEAYIGRHGELLEVRRKKRAGAGRSNGN
ncbi:DUF3305 domain-containing protein [Vibrio panuliri]|uniref:DUF3305 domain-containing protein n=1 Tax=Vibrio panuliri TaxID=1381081 RepID=A0ABX3FE70_9VIBR|nr:DUF3305 domain-containing protein [Vibrio panuliri]KAB1454378.1 DUF3305 domain-containing protein [Vibrio panuliri]OLQ87800.1 hypothetical protein BIY20_02150 [Vibrio panuliri]